jgi:hypothetical protein
MDIINYINTASAQSAGTIIFLLALALIIGSSLLAGLSELTHKSTAQTNYPIRSHNITRSTWLWIFIFSFIGGIVVFLPKAATITQSNNLMIVGISSGLALLFFLLYHFTGKTLRIKALHVPLALIAAGTALVAAAIWFMPSITTALNGLQNAQKTNNELFSGGINQVDIACLSHFFLNAIAVSALFFMLANAKEKERRRKQPREYYFKAAGFAGSWLMTAVTLQIVLSGWLLYNFSTSAKNDLFSPPEVYWLAGITATAFLGWLLLIKINKDALVNYRATLIIALFFIISLSLLHFGPLKTSFSPRAVRQPDNTVKTQKLSSQQQIKPQKAPEKKLKTTNPKQPER